MKKIFYGLILLVILFGWFAARPAQAASATFQISNSTDDVNQDGSSFTTNSSTIWLGNGSSTTASYTGLRFTGVAIPHGATITSAKLKVYSIQNQWVSVSMNMAGELSPNSATFSSTSMPSQRVLTSASVNHSSNNAWSANTWYLLDEMAPVVQQIVNQSGWQNGNSLSIILKGTGGSWGRVFVDSWDGSSANSATLVVSYTSGSTATPTSTLPPSTATATSIPPTPTPTAVLPSPTPTAALPSPTPTSGTVSSTSFSVGPGWADSETHQLVRTADDRLYYFGFAGESSPILYGYWTSSSGLPGSGTAFIGKVKLTNSANILSTDVVYDGAHIIHVLTNGLDGKIIDRPFDTSINQFKTSKVLDTTGGTLSGYTLGTAGISATVDKNAVLHVAFWSSSNHIIYQAFTYNVSTDTLSQVSGPTQIDTGGSACHPELAVSPLDGSLTAAWVSQASSPARILARTYKSGSWGSIETVSAAPVFTSTDSGISIDQSPSLIINSTGTKYLVYIENWRTTSPYDYGRIHFVTSSGTGWSDTYIGSYTHDPALAMNSTGQIYILGHGYPLNSTCTSTDDMCKYQLNSNGTWSPKVFLMHQGTQSFDDSPSVKWSVVGYNRPDAIEFVFSEVGGGYSNPILYYGRIGTK